MVDAGRCAIEVTLGAKPSNASMLDGQRPLARAAVCAAYAQVGRTAARKASPFARRAYMRRSTAGDGCEAESLLAERDRPPILGVCHGRVQESQQARHNPQYFTY